MTTMLTASTIKRYALDAGFDLAGVAPSSVLKDLEFLPNWVKKGFGGEMRYLADPRREDPRRVLPSVKSVVAVGLIYNTPYPYSTEVAGLVEGKSLLESGGVENCGRGSRVWISRYAWGQDYHDVLRRKLEQLRAAIEKQSPDAETRVYVDTGPLVERAFARLSGIGWMGKNTCLINERKGSWFFLGVILTNLELELDLPAPDRCGFCTRCLEACPTGALTEPYVMDASRCISYLNIELKGAIPEKFRTAIGANVFGCDICQDVCPWNNRPSLGTIGPSADESTHDRQSGAKTAPKRVPTSDLPELQPLEVEAKSGGALTGYDREDDAAAKSSNTRQFSLFNPSLEALASVTEEDFRQIFARSPIKRAKYRGWLRNLCVVIGNSGDRRFLAWLEAKARNPDSVVSEHARWALQKLSQGHT